jgi:hypothetical protein
LLAVAPIKEIMTGTKSSGISNIKLVFTMVVSDKKRTMVDKTKDSTT